MIRNEGKRATCVSDGTRYFKVLTHSLTHPSVVVAVNHDGGTSMEVDVLLPPVSDVVGGPPRLEQQVPLHLLSWSILEVDSYLTTSVN